MNAKTLQGSAIALLLAIAGAFPVFAAQTSPLTQSLGSDRNATDVWRLTCPLGTASARAYVSDYPVNSASARVRVKLIRTLADQEEDASPSSNGEGSNASPYAIRSDGAGTYDVIFDKTASGSENYQAYAYCRNGNGGNITSGVSFTRTQNEN